ncbi:DUF2267 domain-containing protein [Roseomonas sp. CCTCC AB2023176]|uniref:DUF2267 domain-containing protein n=1 Tax=Roseomonas sp. CCTCC AB2023176 TaxID=3342640 RepID=UPI0035D5A095
MSTGLDTFDKTINVTNQWLDEIEAAIGPGRPVAWRALGAVLRALRDRLPVELAAHAGAQLPLIVRGLYYEGFDPTDMPRKDRNLDGFLANVAEAMPGVEAVRPVDATRAVFRVLSHRMDPGQVGKIVNALPAPVQDLWLGVAAVAFPGSDHDRRT